MLMLSNDTTHTKEPLFQTHLNLVEGRLYWPGIHECQLLNLPDTPKVLLRSFTFIKILFRKIGMDLIIPLELRQRFLLILVGSVQRVRKKHY